NEKVFGFEIFQVEAGKLILTLLEVAGSGVEACQVARVGLSVLVRDLYQTEVVAIAVQGKVKAIGFEIVNGLEHLPLGLIIKRVQVVFVSKIPADGKECNEGDTKYNAGMFLEPAFGNFEFFSQNLRTFEDFLFLIFLLCHVSMRDSQLTKTAGFGKLSG